ncbi:6437_t:CDS:2 [Ambispora gerdemannii]|uniref:6437_t:CDS:1 n=1 Tax=Ambispora gerdemannii TaxID=144530 RepID=A0A9N9FLV9_9GLOM|nr:6437_t:CDS:2 [Ambispora gerdemannii]
MSDDVAITLNNNLIMFNAYLLLSHSNDVYLQSGRRGTEKALQEPFLVRKMWESEIRPKKLRFMISEMDPSTSIRLGIRNVTTILWFVVTDTKATASLKRQARFIESLAQYHDGNVWDNTIIVTKGNVIHKGPREAAKEIARKIHEKKHGKIPTIATFSNIWKPLHFVDSWIEKLLTLLDIEKDLLVKTSDFKILLFESLEDTNVYAKRKFTSDKLNSHGVFKGSEPERILAKYESIMKEHLEHPISLSFKRVKCLRCPEETDPRLAVPNCHMETERIHGNKKYIHNGEIIPKHTGNLALYHPDSMEQYHPNSVELVHTGQPYGGETKKVMDNSAGAWTLRIVTIGLVNPTETEINAMRWDCCEKNIRSSGCTLVYRCCKKKPDDSGCLQRYKCCHAEASPGCNYRYDCCNQSSKSKGCEELYKICDHKVKDDPCFPVCEDCEEVMNSIGCREICHHCKKIQAESEGCVNTAHTWL